MQPLKSIGLIKEINMNRKLSIFTRIFECLIFSSFFVGWAHSLNAQNTAATTPKVVYEQGKIIGSLPYGRHFYIIGNSKLANGAIADKVSVKIWTTGSIKFKRNQEIPEPATEIVEALEQQEPLVSAEWLAAKSDKPDQFQLYINEMLRPRTEYFVRFSLFKSFSFELTPEEKDEVILNITSEAFQQYRVENQITVPQLEKIINQETQKILERRLNLKEDQLLGTITDQQDVLPTLSVDENTLSDLSVLLGRMSSKQNLIEMNNKTIALEIKPVLDTEPEGSDDFQSAQEEQASIERQNRRLGRQRDSLKLVLIDRLEVVRRQLVRVSSELSILRPEAYNISELDAVNIGTSFGGAVVGLNYANRDARDFDVFSYTALKFHFLPIDKRINEPYLDVFFINRLSFLLGISFTSDFNYKGDELEPVIGFFPILGASYDLSRYFSVDIGATMFKQRALSGLSNSQELRIGPIIGLSFDFDLLNRFKSTFTGEKYTVNPSGN